MNWKVGLLGLWLCAPGWADNRMFEFIRVRTPVKIISPQGESCDAMVIRAGADRIAVRLESVSVACGPVNSLREILREDVQDLYDERRDRRAGAGGIGAGIGVLAGLIPAYALARTGHGDAVFFTIIGGGIAGALTARSWRTRRVLIYTKRIEVPR